MHVARIKNCYTIFFFTNFLPCIPQKQNKQHYFRVRFYFCQRNISLQNHITFCKIRQKKYSNHKQLATIYVENSSFSWNIPHKVTLFNRSLYSLKDLKRIVLSDIPRLGKFKWKRRIQKTRVQISGNTPTIAFHCVKSVRIRGYSGAYFPAFGLNTKRYPVPLCIQSKYGKMRTKITLNTDTFYAAFTTLILPHTTRSNDRYLSSLTSTKNRMLENLLPDVKNILTILVWDWKQKTGKPRNDCDSEYSVSFDALLKSLNCNFAFLQTEK